MSNGSSQTSVRNKLLLLFGSVIFTILAIEGVLRFFPLLRPLPRTYVGQYKNRQTGFVVVDPFIGWKRTHDQRAPINTQGFRSPSDFDPDQPCKRIVLAGDSFTYGTAVSYEKTFGALVETGIPGSCVNNMGMPGFGLDQIWLTVRTYALPLRPRLIVVAFISDDFNRSEEAYRIGEGLNKPAFKLVNGRLVPETAEDRPNFFVQFLQRYSSVWRILQIADHGLAQRYPHGEWWNLNAAILDAIRDDGRRAGIPVLFVYIPAGHWRTFPSLSAYMARRQLNFLDLSQGEFATRPDMYFREQEPGSGHLNELGHRQVADAILRWLQRNLPVL